MNCDYDVVKLRGELKRNTIPLISSHRLEEVKHHMFMTTSWITLKRGGTHGP